MHPLFKKKGHLHWDATLIRAIQDWEMDALTNFLKSHLLHKG